jgi:hypothetical protein
MHFTLAGTVTTSARQYIVDGDIGASTVVIETLQKALEEDAKPDGPVAKPDGAPQKKRLPLQGTLRCKVDNLSYGKFVLNPVQATVVLAPDEIRIDHLESAFCGITVRGGLSLSGGDISVDLKPDAKGLQLEPALTCLAGKDVKVSGVFGSEWVLSAAKTDALFLRSRDRPSSSPGMGVSTSNSRWQRSFRW